VDARQSLIWSDENAGPWSALRTSGMPSRVKSSSRAPTAVARGGGRRAEAGGRGAEVRFESNAYLC